MIIIWWLIRGRTLFLVLCCFLQTELCIQLSLKTWTQIKLWKIKLIILFIPHPHKERVISQRSRINLVKQAIKFIYSSLLIHFLHCTLFFLIIVNLSYYFLHIRYSILFKQERTLSMHRCECIKAVWICGWYPWSCETSIPYQRVATFAKIKY